MAGPRLIAFALGFLLLPCAGAQGQKKDPPKPAAPLPTYPPSPDGLQKLIKDIVAATAADQNQTPSAYLNSLLLPDPQGWFKSVLGEEKGAEVAEEYAKERAALPSRLAATFALFVDQHLSNSEVKRFDKPCDLQTSEDQYRFLSALEQPTRLYEARMLNPDRRSAQTFWFFAYVDGAFRYIGHPHLPAPTWVISAPPQLGAQPPKRLRVGGQVQTAKLIHKVQPKYPDEAKHA